MNILERIRGLGQLAIDLEKLLREQTKLNARLRVYHDALIEVEAYYRVQAETAPLRDPEKLISEIVYAALHTDGQLRIF
jgi:hypothetical protein